MKFSVFRSPARAVASSMKTAWATATRGNPASCLLADGMGGHPEGEVAAQLALQAISALYQKEANPKIEDVPAFLTRGGHGGASPDHQVRGDKGMLDTPRTTLVAALVQDGSPAGCTAAIRGCTWCARHALLTRTRDHSYMEQPPSRQSGRGHAERSTATSCSPAWVRRRKPVFDIGGPGGHCSRATRSCCAPTACGEQSGRREIVEQLA
jgi:hypothetical protein